MVTIHYPNGVEIRLQSSDGDAELLNQINKSFEQRGGVWLTGKGTTWVPAAQVSVFTNSEGPDGFPALSGLTFVS